MLSASPTKKLPAACKIVGYGQRSARKSFNRSSDWRPEPPGSLLRWKLWLITVQCWSFTAQRRASLSDEFAENRSQSGACPCGLLGSMFLIIADVSRAWLLADGLLVNRPAKTRLVVTLGPLSKTATRMPVPSNPAA